MSDARDVIVLHDTDGRPYYAALEFLLREGRVNSVTYLESSVLRLLIRSIVRGRFGMGEVRRLFRNLTFRLAVPFVREKAIVVGMAPYDWRIVWYRRLWTRNRLVLHTSYPYWGAKRVPRTLGPLTPLLMAAWRRTLAANSLRTVTVTDAAHQSLVHFADVKGAVRTIPHSVNRKVFSSRQTPPQSGDTLGVLFVGQLEPLKGIDVLIEVINAADRCRFSFGVAGAGSRSRHLVQACPGVEYYGYVSDKERLAEIYRRHHVLVMPSVRTGSWEELFGIAIIEAMSVGLVVIASDHVGPRSLISDGIDGFLVPERRPDLILERLAWLSSHPREMAAMSMRARQRSEDFDVESVAASWSHVLMDDAPEHVVS